MRVGTITPTAVGWLRLGAKARAPLEGLQRFVPAGQHTLICGSQLSRRPEPQHTFIASAQLSPRRVERKFDALLLAQSSSGCAQWWPSHALVGTTDAAVVEVANVTNSDRLHSRSRILPAITLFPTQAGNTPIALVDPLTSVRYLRWIKSIAGGGTGYNRPDERAMPSGVDATSASCCCGLMSRSRGLHCSAEQKRVLSSIDKQTLTKALIMSYSEISQHDDVDLESLIDHIVLKCADKSLAKGMRGILWHQRYVVFFSAAAKDLLIAVAQPTKAKYAHEDEMKGVTRVHTLHLLPPKNPPPQQGNVAADSGDQQGGDDEAKKKPRYEPFDVYSVENGVEMLKNLEYDEVTKFVVHALMVYQGQVAACLNPHEVLKKFFPADKKLTVKDDMTIHTRPVASTKEDWTWLCSRNVDWQLGVGQFSTVLVDFRSNETWSNDANTAVLIGGESGSGKTMEMICGHSGKSDLVIYMRFADALMRNVDVRLCNTICENEKLLRDAKQGAVALAARDARNGAFVKLAQEAINGAVAASCAELTHALKMHETGETFTVRLCFDEMGDSPAYVRACCAMNVVTLRKNLGWGSMVEIRVVAAGTGIGSVDNPGGSENNFYQLAMLSQRAGKSLYWKMRDRMLGEWKSHSGAAKISFDELVTDVDMIGKHWYDRPAALAKMKDRNRTLSKLFAAHAAHARSIDEQRAVPPTATIDEQVHTKLLQDLKAKDDLRKAASAANDWANQALVQEALFAAIESDGACAAALTNPRMAALFVSVVHVVRKQTLEHELSAATSGTNIRRTVLQRVAVHFKRLNGLKGTTPQEASALLVESLRYVLFGGYVSSTHSAGELISARGVMVDNATYMRKVPSDYEVVLDEVVVDEKVAFDERVDDRGLAKKMQPNRKAIVSIDSAGKVNRIWYTACYPKALGRYSISPAMVVVLTTLMSNAFEENFSNIGDVFERDMAKFLFVAAQAFHGRPVSELVDFIVGPLAFVGAAAQEILKRNTTVKFSSVALRIAGADNDHVGLWSNAGVAHAWVEISPPGLPSADVVLHIPDVITIPVQCKDLSNPFDHRGVASALSTMLVKSKQWRDPDPSKEYSSRRGGHNYAQALQAVDCAFSDSPSAAADCLPGPATGNSDASPEKEAPDFGQKLQKLGAPVIPVLYMSRAQLLKNTETETSATQRSRETTTTQDSKKKKKKQHKLSWDHLNAIGPHCIMAEGIGEHSLDTPYRVFDGPTPKPTTERHQDIVLNDKRLHSARRSIMLFEFRQKAPTDVVGLAVVGAAPGPTEMGNYSSGQCIVFSENLRGHFALSKSVSKSRVKENLEREEILRKNREFLLDDFKVESDPQKAENARTRVLERIDVALDTKKRDEIIKSGKEKGVLCATPAEASTTQHSPNTKHHQKQLTNKSKLQNTK